MPYSLMSFPCCAWLCWPTCARVVQSTVRVFMDTRRILPANYRNHCLAGTHAVNPCPILEGGPSAVLMHGIYAPPCRRSFLKRRNLDQTALCDVVSRAWNTRRTPRSLSCVTVGDEIPPPPRPGADLPLMRKIRLTVADIELKLREARMYSCF